MRNRNSNVNWTIKGIVFVAYAVVFGTIHGNTLVRRRAVSSDAAAGASRD